ncbi:MAG: hypothetical protein WC797_03745 [Candidatus Paceibacterota bacterium]|jgi:hypothetical protein
MSTIFLTVKNIEILNAIQNKSYQKVPLTDDERYALDDFLQNLPSTKDLFADRTPIDELFVVDLFDSDEMQMHLEKWVSLFQSLPKNGSNTYPSAGWIFPEEDCDFWKRKVIIEAEFLPSLTYSRKEENQAIGLNLKIDGTAVFNLILVEDVETFPELYNFKGTWMEAYLLTVKTLKEGWPQTKFPKELEQFLPK